MSNLELERERTKTMLLMEQARLAAQNEQPSFKLGGLAENIIGEGAVDTPGEYLGQTIKAGAAGMNRGIEGLLAFPELVGSLGRMGYQYARGQEVDPLPEKTLLGGTFRDTISSIAGKLGDADAMDFKPDDRLGRFLGTAGEFVGGAGAATKLTKPVLGASLTAGVGSEAAGQATEGTAAEPYARFAGALLAPTGAAIAANTALKPYNFYIKPRQVAKQILTGNEGVDVALGRAIVKPTFENQRIAKNAAYKAADESGLVFTSDELASLAANSREKLFTGAVGTKLNPKFDTHITEALARIDDAAEGNMGLIELDELRREIYTIFKKGTGSGVKAYDPRMRSVIDDLDTLIDDKTQGNRLLNAARLAHRRYKKTQILDDRMKMAELETASSGSGGNILNKYKQAILKIMKNKKERSYFDQGELEAMEAIVRGDISSDLLRQVGKLSPSGNGLMFSINAVGAYLEPSFLGVSALGLGSKFASDRLIRSQLKDLERYLTTGQTVTKVNQPPLTPRLPGVLAQSSSQEENQ